MNWQDTPCEIFQGLILDSGYGQDGTQSAHRKSYRKAFGDVPEGLELDHLCRNRACINPQHLEPVTHAENVRRGMSPVGINGRKTHCKMGHPLSGDNLIPNLTFRKCLECRRIRDRVRRKRNKEKNAIARKLKQLGASTNNT